MFLEESSVPEGIKCSLGNQDFIEEEVAYKITKICQRNLFVREQEFLKDLFAMRTARVPRGNKFKRMFSTIFL